MCPPDPVPGVVCAGQTGPGCWCAPFQHQDTPLIELENARLFVQLCPEFGGGIARFDGQSDGARVPLMRPLRHSMEAGNFEPNQLACYPLVPWSNRITEGGFVADGHRFDLANNRADDPFPIHGTGWQHPWKVQSRTDTSAVFTLDDSTPGAYAFHATLHYTLDRDALHVALDVVNEATRPMPFGLGLHPFFPRRDGTRLQAAASHLWINDGHSPIPTEHEPVPSAWDFRASRPLPQEELNHCFTGWQGSAVIHWPDHDLTLALHSDAGRFILYTPVGADFFCFEPVDHVIDAMHRPGGPLEHGMTRLEPGQRLRRRFTFRLHSRIHPSPATDPAHPSQP